MKQRTDDYQKRRETLSKMTDQELKKYFYVLAEKIVNPLLDLGKENTSKSIERSILLRMGFSSIDASNIVNTLNEHNLLKKGAGHCVYKLSLAKGIDLHEAGKQIVEDDGTDYLLEVFS